MQRTNIVSFFLDAAHIRGILMDDLSLNLSRPGQDIPPYCRQAVRTHFAPISHLYSEKACYFMQRVSDSILRAVIRAQTDFEQELSPFNLLKYLFPRGLSKASLTPVASIVFDPGNFQYYNSHFDDDDVSSGFEILLLDIPKDVLRKYFGDVISCLQDLKALDADSDAVLSLSANPLFFDSMSQAGR